MNIDIIIIDAQSPLHRTNRPRPVILEKIMKFSSAFVAVITINSCMSLILSFVIAAYCRDEADPDCPTERDRALRAAAAASRRFNRLTSEVQITKKTLIRPDEKVVRLTNKRSISGRQDDFHQILTYPNVAAFARSETLQITHQQEDASNFRSNQSEVAKLRRVLRTVEAASGSRILDADMVDDLHEVRLLYVNLQVKAESTCTFSLHVLAYISYFHKYIDPFGLRVLRWTPVPTHCLMSRYSIMSVRLFALALHY